MPKYIDIPISLRRPQLNLTHNGFIKPGFHNSTKQSAQQIEHFRKKQKRQDKEIIQLKFLFVFFTFKLLLQMKTRLEIYIFGIQFLFHTFTEIRVKLSAVRLSKAPWYIALRPWYNEVLHFIRFSCRCRHCCHVLYNCGDDALERDWWRKLHAGL